MRRAIYRHIRLVITLCDACLVALSLMLAFLLRFEGEIPASELSLLYRSLWFAVPGKIAVFYLAGLDRRSSQYAGIADLYSTFIANLAASSCFALCAMLLFGRQFSRSVYLIDFLISFILIGGSRLSHRIYRDVVRKRASKGAARNILIYGAGAGGVTLLRELQMNPSLDYRAVGFLDDDLLKLHTTILNVPVLGTGRDTIRICAYLERKRMRVDEIVIAMPSATGFQMQEALANCRAAGIGCRTIPGVAELLNGKILSSQIREVSVSDLLGRDAVHLDETSVRNAIRGRSVMVTGAAGSIGSELCRQISRFGPRRLIAFEQAESELFRIHNELSARFPSVETLPQIGDIRDYSRIEEVVRKYEVDVFFHAAAYKHVPLMEAHVMEAVRNNIIGTWNAVNAAYRGGVSEFLMISSDKAVNPTNVMGTTKRVAELIVSSFPVGSRPKCVSVRFGNVLGSNGSVVPVFREQIAAGGPVTVTHPDMRRYFMTIPEAAQLVLQAFTLGSGSEIFVLDMGAPVRIADLARNMIRLSGKEPDRDIEIRFTGLRPGEKLFEELILEGEDMQPTPHHKIRMFKGKRITRAEAETWIRDLQDLLQNRQEGPILDYLRRIVPEYRPSGRKDLSSDGKPANRKEHALAPEFSVARIYAQPGQPG